MSKLTRKTRRLERFRAKVKRKTLPELPGKGKEAAREARKVNVQTELARTKSFGKKTRDLNALELDVLKGRLEDSRKELFNLRFKQATGQLQDTAALSQMKRRIARILTLIRQKELGA